tara:strand:- start:8265 stop:9116 length:852 start_codon:yes stop_codon:yes gene_type:complete
MSTEVALSVDNMNLADAMGFSASAASGGSGSNLHRITATVIQEVHPDTNKIVSSPVFKIRKDEDEFYSREIEIRLFAERQRWQKWDSENNTFQKTVMSTNLNTDLKDTLGTFNLGRPTGYIKDFNGLPETTKDIIRSVNRVKVYMGMVIFSEPFYEGGAHVDTYDGFEVPFIADVKNRESLKSIDNVVAKLMNKRISPVEHTITLTGDVRAMPNGNKYAVMQASLNELVTIANGDNDVLQNFVDYVNNTNDYILKKWDETHVEKLDDESSKIVSNIVDLEDFE